MKNKWLGYLSAFILLLAGVLQFIANNILLGCMLVICAIASVVIKFIMVNKTKEDN